MQVREFVVVWASALLWWRRRRPGQHRFGWVLPAVESHVIFVRIFEESYQL